MARNPAFEKRLADLEIMLPASKDIPGRENSSAPAPPDNDFEAPKVDRY